MWRGMSPHVRDATEQTGLWTYASVLRFRDAMRERLCQPEYSFSDLVCFVCLQDENYLES